MPEETLIAARYRLGPLIGRGGMSDVHRARDLVEDRDVAVKLLRAADSTPTDRDRFGTEARAAGRLHHPGIVSLLDGGVDEDRPFLVMELVEGSTLAARIAEGPLPEPEVRRIGARLAEALAHAHARGVVHRDVKPGNVLLDADGRPRLADFGIARLADATQQTVTGQVIGSPAYIAPEQLAAERVGPEADVYALGLVLLEALTGHRAFTGTGIEVAYARIHTAPDLPVSLGPLWVGALGAMTARRPEDRPSAQEVAQLLTSPPAYDPVETAAMDVVPTAAGAEAAARLPVPAVWTAAVAAALALLAVIVLGPPAAHRTAPAAAAGAGRLPSPAAAIRPLPSPTTTPTPTATAEPTTTRHRVAHPRHPAKAHHAHRKHHHGKAKAHHGHHR